MLLYICMCMCICIHIYIYIYIYMYIVIHAFDRAGPRVIECWERLVAACRMLYGQSPY